jgi:hypothetical protein
MTGARRVFRSEARLSRLHVSAEIVAAEAGRVSLQFFIKKAACLRTLDCRTLEGVLRNRHLYPDPWRGMSDDDFLLQPRTGMIIPAYVPKGRTRTYNTVSSDEKRSAYWARRTAELFGTLSKTYSLKELETFADREQPSSRLTHAEVSCRRMSEEPCAQSRRAASNIYP